MKMNEKRQKMTTKVRKRPRVDCNIVVNLKRWYVREREKKKIKKKQFFSRHDIRFTCNSNFWEKLEPLISRKLQTCSSQLEARLTDELNFKNKYELLKIELETCKTELLASKSREIELAEFLQVWSVCKQFLSARSRWWISDDVYTCKNVTKLYSRYTFDCAFWWLYCRNSVQNKNCQYDFWQKKLWWKNYDKSSNR